MTVANACVFIKLWLVLVRGNWSISCWKQVIKN